MEMSEIFSKTCDLAIAHGHKSLNKLPGCLEMAIDECWWFALNAHIETVETTEGTRVPEFTIYFKFNGWPAGLIGMREGCLAAGEAANEDTLIAALDSAIQRKQNEGE